MIVWSLRLYDRNFNQMCRLGLMWWDTRSVVHGALVSSVIDIPLGGNGKRPTRHGKPHNIWWTAGVCENSVLVQPLREHMASIDQRIVDSPRHQKPLISASFEAEPPASSRAGPKVPLTSERASAREERARTSDVQSEARRE